MGHALQKKTGYAPLALRSGLVPLAKFGSQFSMILFFAGVFASVEPLQIAGIALFSLAVLFTLITLPVEINASKRGLDLLQEGSYIPREKEYAAKAVLRAAAMTYVWAAIASLLSLLRLAILVKGNRRRD